MVVPSPSQLLHSLTSGHPEIHIQLCQTQRHWGTLGQAYRFDVVRQCLRDGKAVAGVLARNIGEGGDLNPGVHRQVLEGLPVVVSHIGPVVRHGYFVGRAVGQWVVTMCASVE